MENQSSMTGWQELCSSYKSFQLSAAIAIATFAIYSWKFTGCLILIYALSISTNKIFQKWITWLHDQIDCKRPIWLTRCNKILHHYLLIVVFNFIAHGQTLPLWLHCIQFMIDLLAGLSGPQHLTFALGQLENLSSFIQIIIMLGSLQAVI